MIAHEHDADGGPRSSCGSAAGASRFSSEATPPPDVNPLEPLLKHLTELREYISYYLASSADSVKLSVRSALIKAVMGIVGLLAASAVVITAAVLLLTGMAHGLAVLFGNRLWAGELTTGVVVLAATAAGVYLGVSRLTKSSRRKTIEKYERRQDQQRAAFGHDVHQRAQQAR